MREMTIVWEILVRNLEESENFRDLSVVWRIMKVLK
jgi:hypothetical protein